jgi:hypothetical protein
VGVELERWESLCSCGHLASEHERRRGACYHMNGTTPCQCKKLDALYRTDEVQRRYNYAKLLDAERDYLHVCGWSPTRSGEKILWSHVQRGVRSLTSQQTAVKLQRGWDNLTEE